VETGGGQENLPINFQGFIHPLQLMIKSIALIGADEKAGVCRGNRRKQENSPINFHDLIQSPAVNETSIALTGARRKVGLAHWIAGDRRKAEVFWEIIWN
jgi:hypothetical protein